MTAKINQAQIMSSGQMQDFITFIDRCVCEIASPSQIDEVIDEWHKGQVGHGVELREYLGMDKHEYALWICDANAIHAIIGARRAKVTEFHRGIPKLPNSIVIPD